MANVLGQESSPYLRQHADNPVDWQPWGSAALTRAVQEDKPLLVSVGYSACHWCHVMERESFEDPATAAVMNEHFVCIKVDREERPDVDAIYMEAVQAMTGQGGWPLNVFTTPEQAPFFGGTYFPDQPRHGMPSWTQVLLAVADAWQTRREEIRAQGVQTAASLVGGAALQPGPTVVPDGLFEGAIARLREQFDAVQGGWGDAPKFPSASTIELLLARGETPMALYTLRSMASGGIFDQVGGGFARYSTDATWTVPHFEKMLYDNALLARAYLHGWLVSGDEDLRRVCVETLDWVARELRGPEGGLLCALDADSEGVEGAFYVWTVAELSQALEPGDAEAAIAWLGATQDGNFRDPHDPVDGLNVLEDRGPRPDDPQRERIRAGLLAAREQRVRPGLDDKRLAAWNFLGVAAFADAGARLDRPDYVAIAERAAAFVLDTMRDEQGRLLRTSDGRSAKLLAYLEDHAYGVEALIVLYEATGEPRWAREARVLADAILSRFGDGTRGGFFSTASDAEALIARRKDLEDMPVPAGGSSAALGLLRLEALTGDGRYGAAAEGHLRLVAELAGRHPGAFSHALQAIDLHASGLREVAVVGPAADRAELIAAVRSALRPRVVLAHGEPTEAQSAAVPLLVGRTTVDGRAAAYVCEHFACSRPVTDVAALHQALS